MRCGTAVNSKMSLIKANNATMQPSLVKRVGTLAGAAAVLRLLQHLFLVRSRRLATLQRSLGGSLGGGPSTRPATTEPFSVFLNDLKDGKLLEVTLMVEMVVVIAALVGAATVSREHAHGSSAEKLLCFSNGGASCRAGLRSWQVPFNNATARPPAG